MESIIKLIHHGYYHGNKVTAEGTGELIENEDGSKFYQPDGGGTELVWRYEEDNEVCDWIHPRPCPKCKLTQYKEGYDGCLGHLPGVSFACCGHGVDKEDYVVVNNERLSMKEYKERYAVSRLRLL